MPVVIHKEFIKSYLIKKELSHSESEWESDVEEDVKPKKKRRLTNYNKFIRTTMKVVRGKYQGEKKGYYIQLGRRDVAVYVRRGEGILRQDGSQKQNITLCKDCVSGASE